MMEMDLKCEKGKVSFFLSFSLWAVAVQTEDRRRLIANGIGRFGLRAAAGAAAGAAGSSSSLLSLLT